MPSTALLWYRRDLRVHDHPALHDAVREFDRVVPVFVLDDALLHGRFASAPRTTFMLGCLEALDGELRARGAGLVVRRGRPEPELIALAREVEAEAVLWTSDVAPYARARDRRVTEALAEAGVRAVPHGGNYIADVSRIRTKDGRPFTVFSPFWRAWAQVERRPVHRSPGTLPNLPLGLDAGTLPAPAELGVEGPVLSEPFAEPGEDAARGALERWLEGPIDHYADRQDGMARKGTSGLSPYLRWGCLSPRECEARADRHGGKGAAAWIRQLCWREFYAHVLLAHPQDARLEHQERMRALRWDDDDERLRTWQEGRTGFPLVDAGMRQLARTGWMHNRTRLVVGSFLTKDLHLDWRAGEAWFERLLLDGEPAQNNGNWQWIASVGTDPAPYFRRLYNPARHQERFDPTGEYVRRWVPELAEVPDHRLAEPATMTDEEQEAAGCVIGRDYPEPIVDHAVERREAIARFQAVAPAKGS